MKSLLVISLVLALTAVGCGGDPEPVEEHDPSGEVDVSAEIEAIEGLLDEIATTHAEGDGEAAAELAADAYLEHYEHIEHAVEEADEELNKELEELLGTDIRDALQDEISETELKGLLDEIRGLLDEAAAAVAEG